MKRFAVSILFLSSISAAHAAAVEYLDTSGAHEILLRSFKYELEQ